MLIGAIAGDIIGSPFEHSPTKSKYFEVFGPNSRPTDDTYSLITVAKWLICGRNLTQLLKEAVCTNPGVGWGHMMFKWARSPDRRPYGSYGNGSAMRVVPVAWKASSHEECLDLAAESAQVTHDHPEGIKGAQAVATAIWLARHGAEREAISNSISSAFGYDLSMSIYEVRATAKFDSTCQVSVPRAITAFMESTDYEDAVRNAVSIGADADTEACICGAIAAAYYKTIPNWIERRARSLIPDSLLDVVDEFETRYCDCG